MTFFVILLAVFALMKFSSGSSRNREGGAVYVVFLLSALAGVFFESWLVFYFCLFIGLVAVFFEASSRRDRDDN